MKKRKLAETFSSSQWIRKLFPLKIWSIELLIFLLAMKLVRAKIGVSLIIFWPSIQKISLSKTRKGRFKIHTIWLLLRICGSDFRFLPGEANLGFWGPRAALGHLQKTKLGYILEHHFYNGFYICQTKRFPGFDLKNKTNLRNQDQDPLTLRKRSDFEYQLFWDFLKGFKSTAAAWHWILPLSSGSS